MLLSKPAGRQAAVIKYDVLTAIGAFGMAQGQAMQRLALRLMTLLTARYNWTRNLLAVGQREIAQLWNVDERTVKREMAKLRGMEWLVVKRQGSRGRVTEYGLGLERIMTDTRPVWAAIGSDFEDRHKAGAASKEASGNVVALPVQARGPAPDIDAESEWGRAQAVLYTEHPSIYGSWLAGLVPAQRAGERIVLVAPSRFHAHYVATHFHTHCLSALKAVDPTIEDLAIEF